MTPAEIEEAVQLFLALEPEGQKAIAWLIHKVHGKKETAPAPAKTS